MAKSGNSKTWLILVILAVGAAGGGYWWWSKNSTPPPEFVTVKVTRGDIIQSVTATGDLQPVTTVDVSSQISGLVREVDVDYNSIVKKGDVLARIDPASYESKLNQAQAQFTNTQANYRLVKLNTERTRSLREQKLVSQQELDQAEALLSQAEAQLKIQQAAVDNAKVDLSRCDIFSPIDGIVLDRLTDVGKTVAASLNAPTLFTLAADLTKMQINAAVSEADIGTVEEGQSVNFTVDAYPGRQFRGKVSQIRNSPVTEQNVVTYATIIDVTNEDLKLKPGMTANVSIIVARRDNALRLPNSALRVRIPDSLLPAPDAGKTSAASREQIQQLMIEAGINPNSRRIAPEARARLIQLAKDRGVELPERLLRTDRENSVTTRTIYKLAGTAKAPEVVPVTIKVGITDGVASEIVEGFSEGDEVITSAYLPDGAAADSSPAANPFGGPRRH
ncbi:MAG TPA: efflux RND transporter periplasmic adaptor subunit [Rariglobus sp.]|jgi:HlyD family secretion protein|nr:efflux RND transporter periplasmic adaptor subunit [Rariglobus sp.]